MAKIALIQLVSSTKVAENLRQIEELMIQAREEQAELVVLPENCAFMGRCDTDKLAIAEQEGDGPIQTAISGMAKKSGLWVVAGTCPIKPSKKMPARVRASCMVYDNLGRSVARYDKIHLFDVQVSKSEIHKESLTTEPGKNLVVVDTPVGKIGLTVCYDLRFPELYHQLRVKGAQILSVPSAFTKLTGQAHWDILLRARAIENLCYVLAPNQGGHHENGRDTYGHSMIVEPWGSVLAQKEQGAGIITADVDLSRLEQIRQHFPCVDHHILA